MGERHQLFVIARVGGYYRCLAVAHHQWLYGVMVINRCLGLLRIFSDVNNRLAITQELRHAASYFQDNGPPSDTRPRYEYDPTGGSCPFPFIATSLLIGASLNPASGVVSVASNEPINMGYDEGDNNTGITVLDITDPSSPSYCFIELADGWGGSEADDDASGHPLKASEYLQVFSSYVNKLPPGATEIIQELDDKPVITIQALKETWPWGDWRDVQPSETSSELVKSSGVKGLVEQSIASAIDAILAPGQTEYILDDHTRGLPNFQSILKQILAAKCNQIGQTAASAQLLSLAYKDEELLDWGIFPHMTTLALQPALTSAELRNAKYLNIHGTAPVARSKELWDILEGLGGIIQVSILGQTDKRDDDADLQPFFNLAARERALKIDKLTLGGIYSRGIGMSPWLSASPPAASFPITQLLVYPVSEPTELPKLEYFFLGDALLSPVRFIDGMLRIIRVIQGDPWVILGGSGVSVAISMASASSSLTFPDVGEIGPLPAETYNNGKQAYHSSLYRGCYSEMRNLEPGHWTVVIACTNHTTIEEYQNGASHNIRFRYAFARAKTTLAPADFAESSSSAAQGLEVFSLEGFLQEQGVSSDGLKQALDRVKPSSGGQGGAEVPDEDFLKCMDRDDTREMLAIFAAHVPKVREAWARANQFS